MIRKIGYGMSVDFDINRSSKKSSNIESTTKTSKVENIKRAIQNGTYKIDIQKTARSMARALLF